MSRWLLVLLIVFGLGTILGVSAAVGNGDNTGETVSASDWADDVCGSVGAWEGQLESLRDELGQSNYGARRNDGGTGDSVERTLVVSGAIDRAVQITNDTLGEGLPRAGIPDVGQGEQAAQILQDWADKTESDLRAAQQSLDDDADTTSGAFGALGSGDRSSPEGGRRRTRGLQAGFRARSRARRRARVERKLPEADGGAAVRKLALATVALTLVALAGPASALAQAAEETSTSTSDWFLIAIEGLVVIGFIALGVRTGGIGLGLWGGVGTLILVFGFGLDPGEPPVSAMLIIIAVIAAAAAMEAAGGIDYMVLIASKALRARPKSINFVAPYVSYLLCILTGTSNTFFSIIPVINEVAYANKIRPERPLAGSTVASALGITSSPVAAATATILPLVEVYNYDLVDVLLITIPASIVGVFLMSLVMSRHGADLEDSVEYRRRIDAGLVQPPSAASDIVLTRYAKRSVALFLGAVAVICIFGLFEGLRPTIAAEDGGVEPLSVTPIIQMVMLAAAALIVLLCKVKASDIPGTPIFRSGMVAMIALFGIAWMADTFIANNEDAIVEAMGGLAEKWPFMIAVAIFGVAALTTSQSAATRTMVPLGLALGIGAGYMIAMWTAVVGVLFLPANGTQIAAAEADSTGTTTLGKRVIDHSFQLPLQVAWISTALVGIAIVAVFH